jgi:hypothetical protein
MGISLLLRQLAGVNGIANKGMGTYWLVAGTKVLSLYVPGERQNGTALVATLVCQL